MYHSFDLVYSPGRATRILAHSPFLLADTVTSRLCRCLAQLPSSPLTEEDHPDLKEARVAHADFIKTMADSMLQPKNYTGPDEPNSDSVEGGPKTAETPE